MEHLVYQIWLSNACTPDSATFPKLLESFDSAEEIYNASDREIRAAVGASSSDCTRLLNKDLTQAQKIYDFAVRCKVGLLAYDDPAYPESLRSIPTPPVLLYYRGRLPDFNNNFFCSIVGSRSISDYGRNNAFHLGYDLASAGAIVVSGMAKGIDGVAMSGAIAAGGITLGVLGSGINVCYPKEHSHFSREIVKEGCILTEYPPDTEPMSHNFPKRNRIISGLSSLTVVVEAGERSGALITARHAEKQGRPVYAFPGNVSNDKCQGTNILIKNGARLCTSADDIVRDFMDVSFGRLNPHKLKVKRDVNLLNTLREMQICADAPSDLAFRPSRSMPKKSVEQTSEKTESVAVAASSEPISSEASPAAIDPEAIKLYKRIPPDCDCPIEDLVDGENDIRKVMKCLIKLEMGRFIVMLPGDRVKRNIK